MINMIEKIDRACSVAFTGHRSIPSGEVDRVSKRVDQSVRIMAAAGVKNFISGMALGFDMLAAEQIVRLKKEGYKIRLIAVVPFRGQHERWKMKDRDRYNELMKKADDVIVLSETYFSSCFFKRNDFMLSHSCSVIAYYNGLPKGGTFYTIRRARMLKMNIINVYA